jgi:outer membrane protein assembly factor BamB
MLTAALAASLMSVGLVSSSFGGEAGESATILKAAGVNQGLCLHLGAGRPESSGLTAALAESSDMLVHGLAMDDAALERARKAIVERKVFGRAMVERIESKSLPYTVDQASLAVVEDLAALTAQGISREDILRVVAPDGVLCVREGNRWTRTVKPRPVEMDEWTHVTHGPDGNLVSTDRLVSFPVGLRWIGGLPFSAAWPRNSPGLPERTEGNGWASCRGWVVAGGRVFTLGSNERDNLGVRPMPHQYLSAFDAWNGLPLWKVACEVFDPGYYLDAGSTAALATDGRRVYAGAKARAIAVDAASGKIVTEFPTQFDPARLLLLDGVLVVTSWKEKTDAKEGKGNMVVLWGPKESVGNIHAFGAESGKLLWAKDFPASRMIAADGAVYVIIGNHPGPRDIIAIDLQSGQEKWRIPHTELGTETRLTLHVAGPGYVIAGPSRGGSCVLSAKDGKKLWEPKFGPGGAFIVDGLLNGNVDPLTGAAVKGRPNVMRPAQWGNVCQPSTIFGLRYRYVTSGTRGASCWDWETNRRVATCGTRGACVQGLTPANGMLYTGPNRCGCLGGGQLRGFVAMGPCGTELAEAEFEKPRPVEKGPAFGLAGDETKNDDWPTYLHDAERSAVAEGQLPEALTIAWKVQVAQPAAKGSSAEAWRSRLQSDLSAPVAAGDRVYVAASDEGRVLALDAVKGATVWSVLLGSRLDASPTVYKGLCLIGCADGWVYALSAKDGTLVWRTRVAPGERKLVAWGHVESAWPVFGPVIVHDGLAYANAGRNASSDGGSALVAIDPATGQTVWAKRMANATHGIDALVVRNGELGWQGGGGVVNPKTGQMSKTPAQPTSGLASKLSAARGKITPPGEVDAAAMCDNAIILAGRAVDRKAGTQRGFLAMRPVGNGKASADIALDAIPAGFRSVPAGRWMQSDGGGLAVAGGKVFLSLHDGSVICLGK